MAAPAAVEAALTPAAAPVGLTATEAAARLAAYGPNDLPSDSRKRLFEYVIDVAREPMFLLLLATAILYILLGDPAEAAAVLAAVLLIIGITLHQERKTENALQALRELASPQALVIRDGQRQRVAGREIVPGDLVVLQEGDRVPADGVLEWSTNLVADESLLTGESVPVRKLVRSETPGAPEPGGDDRPTVWSGTWIVAGEGHARVTATGAGSQLGRIGNSLANVEIGKTALQVEVGRMVRVLATLGIGACVVFGLAYGVARANWIDGALAGLTLAISMVPEEFPVVLTVFLALGAWRISRHHVLVRRLPTIETLGSATTLCVDKTGTLTMNRMSVAAIVASGTQTTIDPATRILPPPAQGVLRAALRASRIDAFDPMERAFFALAAQTSLPEEPPADLVREYALSHELLAVTQVWRRAGVGPFDVASKGAPEAVRLLCRLTPGEDAAISAHVEDLAGRGLRVLGVARAVWTAEALPDHASEFAFAFVGLIGLSDPVRPGVPAAIQECYSAGIRVAMITGDYPSTALSIARQIGLERCTACLTGNAIVVMDERALRQAVMEFDVFARVVPEQKLRLVHALQAQGEVVAMTGDGVNDGPALKAADIGIAMGGRGTDVARHAASLVLLDDDFSSIVRAVRMGRRIYDNIRKAMTFILAVHVPIAGMSLVPVLLGWPLVLMPVHVIFWEFITDPACAIGFEREPEETGIMQRPPRRASERLFTATTMLRSLLQGAAALAISLGCLAASRAAGGTENDVRSLTFATLIVATLALMLANRSLDQPIWTGALARNDAFAVLTALALGTLALIVYVPVLQALFRVAPLHPVDLAALAGIAGVSLAAMELTKRLTRQGR